MTPFEARAYRYVESLKATGQFRRSYWYAVIFGGPLENTPIGHVPERSKRDAVEAASHYDRAVVIAGNAII
jgi:hypothetical protein